MLKLFDCDLYINKLNHNQIIPNYRGNWELSDYDSTYLCIDHNQIISTSSGSFQQRGYFLTDGYELVINDDSNDSTSSVGDTIISKMLFSSCNLDSNTWAGNGWMTFQTTVLDTTILGDTVNITNNNFPVYFDMRLLDPQSGEIDFSSPRRTEVNFSRLWIQ